jgi:hypothetical protein
VLRQGSRTVGYPEDAGLLLSLFRCCFSKGLSVRFPYRARLVVSIQRVVLINAAGERWSRITRGERRRICSFGGNGVGR